jgi:hypothetical protein
MVASFCISEITTAAAIRFEANALRILEEATRRRTESARRDGSVGLETGRSLNL